MGATFKKENWDEEHHLHKVNYLWCPLCIARRKGEENPQHHLVPPQQDESQKDMDYLKSDYNPKEYYKNVIGKGEVKE